MKSINEAFKMPDGLENVIDDIRSEGGKSCLVGGAVIDLLQGREAKDWDIEVYGLNMEKLGEVLSRYGNPNLVGKSFGVVKMDMNGVDYDFSVPRKENKIGVGHKDFSVELMPDISPEEAAARRDLTINSMFFRLDDQKLLDPYNGLSDLDAGILRHTSPQFVEDPLRVLRVMQLLPRKGKTVAPETIELCRSLASQYGTLPKERVFEEWNKLLMKPANPSTGLNFLVDCDWIQHFPELDALRYTEQNPEWHPEGNVWNHTMMVVDNAAALRQYLPEEWQRGYMYGALLHDVGKPSTTTPDLRSWGHDKAGAPIARQFMKRLTDEKNVTEQAAKIVEYHMMPGNLSRGDAKDPAWKRLHNRLRLDVLAYMSRADSAGRSDTSLEDPHPPSEKAHKYFGIFGQGKIPAILLGRDLIDAGYKPGKQFGEILDYAYNLQIDRGVDSKDELIKKVQRKYAGAR